MPEDLFPVAAVKTSNPTHLEQYLEKRFLLWLYGHSSEQGK
jgi:hypothetical protein